MRDTLVDGDERHGEGGGAAAAPIAQSYAAGELVCREGDPATRAYLLRRGRVRLFKRVQLVERSLSTLGAGSVFGEIALLSPMRRYGSSAVALTDVVVAPLDRGGLRELLAASPELAESLIAHLTERLAEAEDHIEITMLRNVHAKVARALVKLLAARSGRVELAITQLELAARAGVDVATAKACVSRLRAQGYVHIHGESVEVPDVAALDRVSQLLAARAALDPGE